VSEQAAVSLAGVAFAYPDGGHCLYDITLEVAAGANLAIVGPNGSGKTTILRLAAGQLRPDQGCVRVCGIDPFRADRRVLARQLAVVGPQTEIGFSYCVEEVVLMGRAPHVDGFRLESAADLAAAWTAMEAMDVAHLAHRDFDSLSSGEKQRASVARALAQEPRVLLLDEPAAFLDIRHQVMLYDLLDRLASERGLTVVSVLHDLNLAALYFDRVAMVSDGRLAAVGAPEAVITYASVREVFRTDVYVDLNDLTGQLNVLPLPLDGSRRRR
jgi:iron complex transport system ATP-binding protein